METGKNHCNVPIPCHWNLGGDIKKDRLQPITNIVGGQPTLPPV